MSYLVVFYALRSGLGETVLAARRIESGAVAAYTRAPSRILAELRRAAGAPRTDGFRIADERGLVVFDCLIRGDRP